MLDLKFQNALQIFDTFALNYGRELIQLIRGIRMNDKVSDPGLFECLTCTCDRTGQNKALVALGREFNLLITMSALSNSIVGNVGN